MVFNRLTAAFVLLLTLPFSAQGASLSALSVPDLLKPWQDWVLYGHEELLACTPSSADPQEIQCDWPSSLELHVSEQGADFTQKWLVQHERWIQLPGNLDNWPENIKVDGLEAVVLNRGAVPQVHVPAGNHTLTGRFSWTTLPEFISIPAHTAIVRLVRFGETVAFPNFDPQGRLWLKARDVPGEQAENRLTIQSFRLLEDRIPFQETISLQLEISGTAREVLLGPVFSTGTVLPVSINSSLPARLEPDGRLKIQVRPGRWDITLTTRHTDPVDALTFFAPEDGHWPEEEIWSFSARPNLRVVEIEGVPSIDPLQTSLPESWRRFPAYRIRDGETVQFREVKRGDPHPAPDQLILQRNVWLRFDGSGYTIQDSITGSKTSGWRLEMRPPVQLGRVAVDGLEQFITSRDGTENTGIELRSGMLNLTADSTYHGPISRLPATGWDHDFQQVTARLALPPGWRLINASGIDSINNTWVKRWTLLDFFLVLIFTIAVARLYSYPLGLFAFLTLVLIYHEPDAPRWIWLAVLAGAVLLRYLPAGRFKTAVKIYQLAAILVLIGIAIPFSIQQLRVGIYPQLEKPWQSMLTDSRTGTMSSPSGQMAAEQMSLEKPARPLSPGPDAHIVTGMDKLQETGRGYGSGTSRVEVAQYDPSMINQTGPGVPDWQWNTYAMSWSGPVQRDQSISLLYTGPRTNLILSFVRVLLLIVLILGILEIRYARKKGFSCPGLRLTVFFSCLAVSLLCSAPLRAGEIPPTQMLDELQHRLLKPDTCFPGCADIGSMTITILPAELRIAMHAEAAAQVFFPLPGNGMHWLPQDVRIDDREAEALFRTDDTLMILLPEGKHRITMTGRVPAQNSLQLPLPLKPHRVEYSSEGWTVEGIHENGIADNQVQFTRILKEQQTDNQILSTGVLPPFLIIERTLRLGLTWKIDTTVRRVSPAGAAVVFAYPLLPGESILTEDIRTGDNKAQINLDANQAVLQWESTLTKTGTIRLLHAETTLWTEIWQVDASPIYHLETEGIPVILHQQGNRWHPTWHPWPGEEVRLTVTRPPGVEGRTLTIEKTHLEIHPGRRATDTTLTMWARSSQGGQHAIVLPEAALLREVAIDGVVRPIRQEQRLVPLPIKPGRQEIKLTWRNGTGITTRYRTPAIDLGAESVNANIDVFLPPNRWPLFVGGPVMGPAVLFWSVVLILLLVAFGLGRTGLTPLRFHQWFLLGIGMSQSNIAAGLLVALWLIALDLRKKANPEMDKTTFNLMQIGLGFMTLLALGSLISAISTGLLGHPDMNIVGNGSHSGLLRWYQDQSSRILPRAWVISIPMFIYRLAMLAWALWISFSLINLLKWGWLNFSQPVLWYRIPRKVRLKEKKRSDARQPSGSGEKE